MSEHQLKLSRTRGGGVFLVSNGRECFFSPSMWEELSRMVSDFNRTQAAAMQNYVDLPTRTPIHKNTASSIEDLA